MDPVLPTINLNSNTPVDTNTHRGIKPSGLLRSTLAFHPAASLWIVPTLTAPATLAMLRESLQWVVQYNNIAIRSRAIQSRALQSRALQSRAIRSRALQSRATRSRATRSRATRSSNRVQATSTVTSEILVLKHFVLLMYRHRNLRKSADSGEIPLSTLVQSIRSIVHLSHISHQTCDLRVR